MLTTQSQPIIRWSVRFTVILLLAAAFTRFCIRESQDHGRLAITPNYDDVVYLLDGATVLNAVRADGVSGFQAFVAKRSLHSPYSIFLAAAAYATMGFDITSPYIANGILVFVYLALISWFLRRLDFVSWISGLTIFLSIPLITMGVVEFRPDIAWAIVTGFGVVWLITSNRVFTSWTCAVLAGVLLSLSLLTKPTTFVMTVILYTGAIFSRIISSLWVTKFKPNIKDVLAKCLVFVGVTLVLAGPYWVTCGVETWNYFILNSFGQNKSTWAFGGTLSDNLLYYLTGDAADSNIAVAGRILSVFALICGVLLAIKRQELRWKLFVLVGLILGAFFINFLAEMKSPFLAGGFYGSWVFSCAFVIGEVMGTGESGFLSNTRYRWAKIVAIVLIAFFAVKSYKWPTYSLRCERVVMDNDLKANAFFQALLKEQSGNQPRMILFCQAGPIVMESVGLWFETQNRQCGLHSATFIRREQDFRFTYPSFEWIILQEQGAIGSSPNVPSEKLLPLFREILEADKRYHVIGEFVGADGKKVWVYSRLPVSR